MATIYGNTTNHWRCYINTWSSEDATSVSAGLTVGIQDCGWGFQIWTGIVGTANANGASNSVNTSFNTSTGSWSTKDITSASQRFAKGHSAYNVTLSGSVTNQSGYMNGTSSASQTITIPALASHTVSFNANGGTGAPGSQTKWYGTVLTLSTTQPTRSNYKFLGWSTTSTGGVEYQPGGQYGADANITLYAVWELLYVEPYFALGLAYRTNSINSTTIDYSGGYCYASFRYWVDTAANKNNLPKTIECKYYQDGNSTGVAVTPTGDFSKPTGTVNIHFQASINSVYYIECRLTDRNNMSMSIARSISTGALPMEVANQGKSVGILSAAPKSSGLNAGGPGNPEFLITANTTNNRMDSFAQIHGQSFSDKPGVLTISTQGTDSGGSVQKGTINLIANDLQFNGSSITRLPDTHMYDLITHKEVNNRLSGQLNNKVVYGIKNGFLIIRFCSVRGVPSSGWHIGDIPIEFFKGRTPISAGYFPLVSRINNNVAMGWVNQVNVDGDHTTPMQVWGYYMGGTSGESTWIDGTLTSYLD